MKQYCEMAAVPTEWLYALPAHWDCKKIGSLFSERKTKVSDKDYAPLSVAKIGVVPQLESAVKTDAGDNRKLVCAGDFVINSRSDRKGSCGVADRDGSVSLINMQFLQDVLLVRTHAEYQRFCRNFKRHMKAWGIGFLRYYK